MAKQEVDVQTAPAIVGYDDTQFEWENVSLEAPDQITFDTIGDTLIAEYLGYEVIEFENTRRAGDGPTGGTIEEFTQLKFMLPGNNPAVVNAGYDLLKVFVKQGIQPGTIVRVQYLKDVDVDQQSPMKSYRVDAAKSRPAAEVA